MEMVFPQMVPRMEKFRNETALRVKTSKVRAFVKIAINAGQRKVFGIVRASVDLWDDVLHVKRSQR